MTKKKKDTAIPFVNQDGHVMRLSGAMRIRDLLKIGVIHITVEKPDAPLKKGEWREQ